jgi:hypothetical protein
VCLVAGWMLITARPGKPRLKWRRDELAPLPA